MKVIMQMSYGFFMVEAIKKEQFIQNYTKASDYGKLNCIQSQFNFGIAVVKRGQCVKKIKKRVKRRLEKKGRGGCKIKRK